MNSRAAEELMACMMHDDFVQRRKALDDWSRRWVASVRLSHPASKDAVRVFEQMRIGAAEDAARYALTDKLVRGMVEDQSVKALRWERFENERSVITTVEMNVILQEPRELP